MNKNKKNQEMELKLDLLNRENHRRLLNLLKVHELLIQENYFFDSEDYILRSSLLALRIRQENGSYILTVKGPKKEIEGLTVRDEYEEEITASLKDIFLSKGIFAVNHPEIPPLYYLNSKVNLSGTILRCFLKFTNTRIISEINSIQVELDETDYGNNRKSYELEVEFNNLHEFESSVIKLQNFFYENDMPWKIAEMSKFARALENKR